MNDYTLCKACNNATLTYTSSHSGHPCCVACKFSRVTNLRDTNLRNQKVTRALWVIRESLTQSWCTSSKFADFGSFDDAAIYVSEANALKAVKNLSQLSGQQIRVNSKCYLYGDLSLVDKDLLKDIGILTGDPQYEAVKCILTSELS